MPLCSYQQAPDRNDRTVVENIFLREFMPAAPEGAVKAYLYGLMQCQQVRTWPGSTLPCIDVDALERLL